MIEVKVHIVLILLAIHFIMDFVLQTDWMAFNKSKHMKPLLAHVGIYSLGFIWLGIEYALLNGLLHLVTDFISSRVTSKLYRARENHWFFVVVGLDQLLHQTALLTTYYWMFN